MKHYIFLFAVLLLAIACRKEEQPLPSGLEDQWFVIEDEPENPLRHKVFEIYSDWGVPVFYNDTIGRQDRGIDRNGNPIVFWKILSLDYNLNNPVNLGAVREKYFSRVKSGQDIMAGLDFVNEVLLPALPETFYIHSILLIDTLYEEDNRNRKYPLSVLRGMETLAVADVPQIALMNEGERQVHSNKILTYLAAQYLSKNEFAEMAAFKKVSYDLVNQRSYYGMQVCMPRYPGYSCLPPDKWEVYGFLDYDRTNYASVSDPDTSKWSYYLVKEEEDLQDFIMAVLTYSEGEFATLYGSYSKVMEKYSLMKKMMVAIGFTK